MSGWPYGPYGVDYKSGILPGGRHAVDLVLLLRKDALRSGSWSRTPGGSHAGFPAGATSLRHQRPARSAFRAVFQEGQWEARAQRWSSASSPPSPPGCRFLGHLGFFEVFDIFPLDNGLGNESPRFFSFGPSEAWSPLDRDPSLPRSAACPQARHLRPKKAAMAELMGTRPREVPSRDFRIALVTCTPSTAWEMQGVRCGAHL